MIDAQLLEKLKTHPDRAVGELVSRYGALAVSVAGRMLPPQDAEEVAADTMVKVWQSAAELDPQTLRGFIITAARNLAVDRWRALRRRGEVPLFDDDREDTAFLEEDLIGRELTEQILSLSPPDGEIFLRHYLLLEPAKEIGTRFGLTESAVRARLHRTREILKKEVSR